MSIQIWWRDSGVGPVGKKWGYLLFIAGAWVEIVDNRGILHKVRSGNSGTSSNVDETLLSRVWILPAVAVDELVKRWGVRQSCLPVLIPVCVRICGLGFEVNRHHDEICNKHLYWFEKKIPLEEGGDRTRSHVLEALYE